MATNYNGAENMDYSTASPFTFREGEYLEAHPEANDIDLGESTMRRLEISGNNIGIATQAMRLTYFTAKKTEVVNNIRCINGNTAAGATPTLCRIGLYLENPDLSLTLVASTPNDTALFNAVFGTFTKALSAPYTKIRGQRYAIGLLIVTAAATPTFHGNANIGGAVLQTSPKITALVNGQSDLPGTIASGSLAGSTWAHYVEVTP